MANVFDPGLGDDKILGDCPKTVMLESSNGIKVGLIGLAEREWYVKARRQRKDFHIEVYWPG